MENYILKPQPVEVYQHSGRTDVILRRNIRQETRPEMEGQPAETVWACEEVQARFRGSITKEEIEARFDFWWDKCDNWSRDVPADPPTLDQRVSDVELMLADIIGGGAL